MLTLNNLCRRKKVFIDKLCKVCYPIVNNFSSTKARHKVEDRRLMLASLPPKDEGVQGEKSIDIDASKIEKLQFPDENTPNTLYNGVRFADVPICHIRVSKNNTLMTITDAKGSPIIHRSCGIEGFKHTRKGTNIAAQATGITLGLKAKEKGVHQIRILVKGLGPGRMSSIKGLEMGGMDIISITDRTPLPDPGPRPRKQKRL